MAVFRAPRYGRLDAFLNSALDDAREDLGRERDVRLFGGGGVAQLASVIFVPYRAGRYGRRGARVRLPERPRELQLRRVCVFARERPGGPVPQYDAALLVQLTDRKLEEPLHLLCLGLGRPLGSRLHLPLFAFGVGVGWAGFLLLSLLLGAPPPLFVDDPSCDGHELGDAPEVGEGEAVQRTSAWIV